MGWFEGKDVELFDKSKSEDVPTLMDGSDA